MSTTETATSVTGADDDSLWSAFDAAAFAEREAVLDDLRDFRSPDRRAALSWEGKPVEGGFHVEVRRSGVNHCVAFVAPRDGVASVVASLDTENPLSALQYLGILFASALLPARAQPAADDQPHEIGNGIPSPEELRGLRNTSNEGVVPHTAQEEIRSRLQHGQGVYVEGRTGTGKSALVRSYLTWWLLHPRTMIRLDMIQPHDGAETVAHSLLALPYEDCHLVVVEHVQADVQGTKAVFELIEQLRERLGVNVSLLASGWLGGALMARTLDAFDEVSIFHTEPTRVMRYFFDDAGIEAQDAVRIQQLAQDNVLFALHAVQAWQDSGCVPAQEEFVDFMAERLGVTEVEQPACRQALYKLACLAEYEIDVPINWAHARMRSEIDDLLAAGLVEVADTSYRIAGRSLAQVIGHYAVAHWHQPAAGQKLESKERLIARYLRERGGDQIDATLKRLSDVGLVEGPTDELAEFLVIGRRQRDLIAQRLSRRIREEDGRWGENAAAAIYAGMAAALLKDTTAWQLIRRFVHDSWHIPDVAQLPRWRGDDPTEEIADYQRMRELMLAEDEALGADNPWPEELRGAAFQTDTAHRTAMLGLLLSFESRSPVKRDNARLRQLRDCAINHYREQLGGVVYPARVPMISARMLFGLCDANYGNLPVTAAIAGWLRRRQNGSPYDGAYTMSWKSGIGEVADPRTAAWCLISLNRYGGEQNPSQISTGLSQLAGLDADSASYADIALRLRAILSTKYDARHEILPELRELMQWAADGKTWSRDGHQHARLELPDQAPESTELALAVWLVLEMYEHLLDRGLPELFRGGTGIPPVGEVPAQRGNGDAEPAESAAEAEEPETQPLTKIQIEQLTIDLDKTGRRITKGIESSEKGARGRARLDVQRRWELLVDSYYRCKLDFERIEALIDTEGLTENVRRLLDDLMRRLDELE
ncbi:MAG TPA: hypothetical protein VFU65_18040 [Actinocrinis sp.]|nr:hypothetical protein [Actinocrinis sp.]